MKKLIWLLSFLVIFFIFGTVSASAVVNDTVRVGLRYGSSAMASANLENISSGGYTVGYYDSARSFCPLGTVTQNKITMVPADSLSGIYHVQLGPYDTFAKAAAAASTAGGWPVYLTGAFYVRTGCYTSNAQAQSAADGCGGGTAVSSTTAVAVTDMASGCVLFEFDCQGFSSLAVVPNSDDGTSGGSAAWFRGYRYAGGFEYPRVTGGNLYVINVLGVEDYVKGVVPYEMNPDWPAAALEAQAVCARTYAYMTTKHLSAYGFDLCNTTDCQVYYGIGSYTNCATAASDAAVDATAGLRVYYNGGLAETVYHSSDGGATESAENVWGGSVDYLIGKEDPYEAMTTIPDYTYSLTYTAAQLTSVLQSKGYSIGTIRNVYVSQTTPTGNVCRVTFVDTSGNTLTVKNETCRSIFYSSTYGKSVRSMRFTISGGKPSAYYINGTENTLPSLSGAYTISGSGTVSAYSGSSPYVITSSGTAALTGGTSSAADDGFTIIGTGNGHNVGMSQYGAKAMAEQGYSFLDILNFYYTNVTVR